VMIPNQLTQIHGVFMILEKILLIYIYAKFFYFILI
jgi:hypothetical protein